MPYPYYYPTYQSYTPTYQQNAPTFQQNTPSAQIIWVSGPAEAQSYPIAPNNAVTLWDKSGQTVYVKQADATGRPSMRIYDLVERKEMASESVSPALDKLSSYVTKDALDEEMTALRADIESIKADVYGIAGRKRKRAETDDE